LFGAKNRRARREIDAQKQVKKVSNRSVAPLERGLQRAHKFSFQEASKFLTNVMFSPTSSIHSAREAIPFYR